jgi:hypothetical protein
MEDMEWDLVVLWAVALVEWDLAVIWVVALWADLTEDLVVHQWVIGGAVRTAEVA